MGRDFDMPITVLSALTLDELGPAWDGGKFDLPLRAEVNGALFGAPEAGQDMTFDFPRLIAHAARTRHVKDDKPVSPGHPLFIRRKRKQFPVPGDHFTLWIDDRAGVVNPVTVTFKD